MNKPEMKKYVVTRELRYEVWAYSEADALALASQKLTIGFPMATEVKEPTPIAVIGQHAL